MRYARIENGIVAEIRREEINCLSRSLKKKYVPCGEEVCVGQIYADGKFITPSENLCFPNGDEEAMLSDIIKIMAKEYLGITEKKSENTKKELARIYKEHSSEKDIKKAAELKRQFKEMLKEEKNNGK